jgi:ABC-type sugar transport system ATPase subunit
MSVLKVAQISKQEGGGMLLQGISFNQQRLQKIAIAGATGSGKTTLLKIIGGLVQPSAGEVLFEGKKVTGPAEQLIPGHPGIAYLSQHFELRNNYRVEEVLEYANLLPEEKAATLYEVCRISSLLRRKTDQLSGGERQRIALARLLGSSPRLLLLDEPFSNLDPSHKNNLKAVIRDIGEKLKITCILVSHDPLDTLSWADEILVLEEGQVRQKGTPEQIYRRPVNEYVAGLFGNYNLIGPQLASALSTKPGIIRPELFKITRQDDGEGVVSQVSFVGRSYEVEVLMQNFAFTVSTSGHYAKGDRVYISLDPDRI